MVEGKAVRGDQVCLIVDNDGYFTGVSLAEKLAEEGKQVTLMTHLGHIAPYMHFTLEAPEHAPEAAQAGRSRSSRTRSRRRWQRARSPRRTSTTRST